MEDVNKDLKGKAVRGGMAKVFAQAANFLLRVGSLMIFARLLEPEDFGLVGMVTAVTGVLGLFKDFGLSSAAIQRSDITQEQSSNLFWLNQLVGGLLGLFTLAISPALVSFYQEPRLLGVTAALASGFVFNAAGVQHSAILQRQMRFTTLAAIEIFSLVVSTAVGIAMAVSGFGYWSLVGWSVSLPVAASAGAWWAVKWIPRGPRRGTGIGSMIRFGGTVTLNGLVIYIAYNLDKVLLGRFWGADALGMYGRAYQLINMPVDNLTNAIGGVMFSALSRLQNDRETLKSYFLKGYKIIVAANIPVIVFCTIFSEDLILVFLGDKWEMAIPIFRLLTPMVLAFVLINPLGWLLWSVGLVGRSLKIAMVITPLVIVGYSLGLPHGPNGVAFGFSAAMALWIIPHILWCIKGTEISRRDILSTLKAPLISVVFASCITLGVQSFINQVHFPIVRLALGASVMFASYIIVLFWVMKEKAFFLDILVTLRNGSRKSNS
jgi:O-antigen/teichoic acid export membrane protein